MVGVYMNIVFVSTATIIVFPNSTDLITTEEMGLKSKDIFHN